MVTGINHLNLAVSNLEVSFDFYTNKLKFKPLAKWKRGVYLLAGDLWFTLLFNRDRPPKVGSDYTHYAFTVSQAELNYYRQNIKQFNFKLWQENTSEVDSLYIFDSDNYKLEFPVGNWQTRIEAIRRNPYEEMIFYI